MCTEEYFPGLGELSAQMDEKMRRKNTNVVPQMMQYHYQIYMPIERAVFQLNVFAIVGHLVARRKCDKL